MAIILLVDDSVFQRKNMAKMLLKMGHEVTTAENGQVALDRLEAETPDLILTDLLMPVMGGINLLQAVKNRGISIPTIVASADIQDSTRDECLRLGAKAFLNKPVSISDLESAIDRSLSATAREKTQC